MQRKDKKPPQIFANLKFTFGKSLKYDFDKFEFTKKIKQYGGAINTLLSPSTTHYLVEEWEKSCEKCCGFVVQVSYLYECLEKEEKLEELDFLLSPPPKEEDGDGVRNSGFLFSSNNLRFSATTFLEEGEDDNNNNNILVDDEEVKEQKMTLTQLREIQRLERERERLEKKERMEQEKREKKLEMEREKQLRLEEIQREKEEKKKEIMELLKPAFVNEDEIDTFSSEPFFESCSSTFSFIDDSPVAFVSSPLDDLFSSMKLEERQEKEIEKQKRKEEKEKLQFDKMELLRQKKLAKKKQIKENIAENVKIGKQKAFEYHIAKVENSELILARIAEERRLKQEKWVEEQKKRREDWERKKIERKQEKKEKKAKWRELKDQILECEESEKGRKVFFGKLDFSDILGGKEMVVKKEFLLDKRKECFMNIFKSYGEISQVKENWEKGFIFVVYSTVEEAEKAANELAIYKNRKKHCAEQKARLSASGSDPAATPLPIFYTRWPKNQSRTIEIPPSEPPKPPKPKPSAPPPADRGRGGRGARGSRGARGGRGAPRGVRGSPAISGGSNGDEGSPEGEDSHAIRGAHRGSPRSRGPCSCNFCLRGVRGSPRGMRGGRGGRGVSRGRGRGGSADGEVQSDATN